MSAGSGVAECSGYGCEMAMSTDIEAMPEGIDATVSLNEWASSRPLGLTDRDLEMIDTEINADRQQLTYTHERDGTVSLQTTHYVGVVSLPDGPTV